MAGWAWGTRWPRIRAQLSRLKVTQTLQRAQGPDRAPCFSTDSGRAGPKKINLKVFGDEKFLI